MNEAKDKIIIEELVRNPSEKEWFDFKENWYEPNAIGNTSLPFPMLQHWPVEKKVTSSGE